DGRDVGMVQRREDFGLALKTEEPLGVRGQSLRQHLEGDLPLQIAVDRTIDFAHTTRADPGGNLVRSEGGTRRQRLDLWGGAAAIIWPGQAYPAGTGASTAGAEAAAVF